jgi:hypothetical protein
VHRAVRVEVIVHEHHAGIVDQDGHVITGRCGGCDLVLIGDVKRDRVRVRVGDRLRFPGARIHLGRTGGEQ